MRSRKNSTDTLKQMKMKAQNSKLCGHWESNPKRDIYSSTCLSKKKTKTKTQDKAQINNLILHLKKLKKEPQTKPKVSSKMEIIKIREEINEIESKKRYTGSMNPRAISLKT